MKKTITTLAALTISINSFGGSFFGDSGSIRSGSAYTSGYLKPYGSDTSSSFPTYGSSFPAYTTPSGVFLTPTIGSGSAYEIGYPKKAPFYSNSWDGD
jgi:PPE-repeat protein